MDTRERVYGYYACLHGERKDIHRSTDLPRDMVRD
jgi:hypothetical protein